MGKAKKQMMNKIAITQQPPPTFANQHGGKRNGFVVAVKACTPLSSAILKVELVYADDFSKVPETCNANTKRKRGRILQILELPNEFNSAGEASVRVRINDVSRNHRGRLFCLRLSVVNQGVTTASVHTTPIKVISKLSKLSKRKRMRREQSQASFSSPCVKSSEHARKRCCNEVNSAVVNSAVVNSPVVNSVVASSFCGWHTRAFNVLKSLERHVIGIGPSHTKITQCPSCLVFGNSMSLQHAETCPLAVVLKEFQQFEGWSANKSNSECSPSSDDESHKVSSDDMHICGTRTIDEDTQEQFEASCLSLPTQVGSDAEEEASPFDDDKVMDFDELLALIDPISLLD